MKWITTALVFALVAGPLSASAGEPRRPERHLLRLINHHREDKDRERLRLDTAMLHGTRRHSWEMAKEGGISHSRDLGERVTEAVGENWTRAAELIGAGSGTIRGMWMVFRHSPRHHKLLRSRDYERIAVGIRHHKRLWWITIWMYADGVA